MAEAKLPAKTDEAVIEKLPSNSNRSKEKQIQPVVKGHKTKRSALQENGVLNYIVNDVLVPSVKDMIFSLITNGMSMAMFGEASNAQPNRRREGHTSYEKYYEERNYRRDAERRERYNRRGVSPLVDVEFEYADDAEDVLESLIDLCDRNGQVSIAEYYQLANERTEYTDFGWGWYDSRRLYRTRPQRKRNGMWILPLPRPVELNGAPR